VRLYEVDLCRLEGNPERALELMDEVVAQAGDAASARLHRGIIYLDLEQYENAARDLQRAIDARPHDATAHFKLSEAYRGMRREDLARRHRELAVALNEKHRRIAVVLDRLRRDPQDDRLHEQLVDLYREVGNHEAARQWQERRRHLVVEPSSSQSSK
jgi:tetratricopeptide (TPR) repeat protein